jgi:hypothetical protein
MAHDLMMIALGWAIPGFLGWLLTKIPPIQKKLLKNPSIAVAGVCCLFSVLSSITAVFLYDRFFVQQVYLSDVVELPGDCGGGGMEYPRPAPYNGDQGSNTNKCPVTFPPELQHANVSNVFLAMTGFDVVHQMQQPNYYKTNSLALSVADVSNKGFNVEVVSKLDEIISSVRIAYIALYRP